MKNLTQEIPKPFLKWAGGKTQLLPVINEHLPIEKLTDGTIKKYVEPFVGSGALLFNIMNNFPQVEEAHIYDVNPELINVYKSIQKNVGGLIEILSKLEAHYLEDEEHERRKHLYYSVRKEFNDEINKINNLDLSKEILVNRAAQFIFLNRTCFNGLFRVNKKGEYNVPMGKYKNPTICNKPVLTTANEFLQNVHIELGDYHESEGIIDCSTFVYFDPPYKPISKSSSFTSYSKYDFDDENQIQLRDYFNKLHDKKAYLMLSNSDPENIDENGNFFDYKYKIENTIKNYNINRVHASRRINSKASNRGEITELLITNYN